MKPDPSIYLSLCRKLGVWAPHAALEKAREKGRVVMIGDSRKCDRDGPRAVGIVGYHLDRSGQGKISDLVQFASLVTDHNRVG